MAATFEEVGNQFTDFYYQTFDSNRSALVSLYRDNSMLTFEGSAIQGASNIVQKLVDLPFAKVQHQITTRDAQPTGDSGAIMVVVTGALLTEGDARPMSFIQTFHLVPDAGSYFVYNDVFRLVYPAS